MIRSGVKGVAVALIGMVVLVHVAGTTSAPWHYTPPPPTAERIEREEEQACWDRYSHGTGPACAYPYEPGPPAVKPPERMEP